MKIFKYILPIFILSALFVACDTDDEAVVIQDPYTYEDLYYQNLRDYKASDHSIAWGWFADYTQSHSMAIRFLGLPDSLDICSLWGGIPSDDSTKVNTFYNPEVAKEMRFVQQTKGIKLVVPTIMRILAFNDNYDFYVTWKNATTQEERLKAVEQFGDYLLRPVFENDLDGVDLDFEPEGDPIGNYFDYLVEYLGKYVGPMSENPDKLLCIDYYGQAPSANTEPYTNWYVNQTYGGSAGRKPFNSCPIEKVVYTENVGDTWKNGCGQLLNYASYQPSSGRKGGFGAFYMHRDYANTGWGCNNYAYFRHGIQIQNPAIY